jgi:anti-repressor protein
MAKELSMLERNNQGKLARQYFIKCEQTLKEVMQNANLIDLNNLESVRKGLLIQAEKIALLQPKAEIYEQFIDSKELLNLRNAAKLFNIDKQSIFFKYLHKNH